MQQTTVKLPKLPSFFLNKIVVITGASSGIGRTLSYWYLNNGAKVALVARDFDELTAIASEFPGQSLALQVDLTDDHQCWDMRNAVVEKFGGIDILINAAGAIFAGDIENTYP
jgi:NADP-dependent 3-hydroxy acid dehydrogenase YdfG